jgi:hypothetical protein
VGNGWEMGTDHGFCNYPKTWSVPFFPSGFFWSREKINSRADKDATPETCRIVGSIINRGSPNKIPLHDIERKDALKSIWGVLNDEV